MTRLERCVNDFFTHFLDAEIIGMDGRLHYLTWIICTDPTMNHQLGELLVEMRHLSKAGDPPPLWDEFYED